MGFWLPVSIFLILLAIMVGMLLPVRVKVRATGSLQGLSAKVWVKPPLWPYYLKMPIKVPQVHDDGMQKRGPERTARRDEHPLTETLWRARDGLASIKSALSDMKEDLSLAMEAVTFESVKLTGKAGTGEASGTAILCGTVNMLAGVFLSVAQRKGARFRRKPFVRVDPVFNGVHFSFLVEIETSFTPARVLYVAGRVTRHLKTAGFGDRKQSAILSRESGILN